ncbi:unnamed protein product [Paramecium sonneborni]|uniref:Uncharacterized protein n=1 Tax=Paramecium sonneborni TaxID=65129 RepID=A0A8S1R304_9CILI|nr:unnamed protein product [Paramecium sonneborni]
MNIRQPLQSFNSIERNPEKGCKSISEIETFLKEIDRLQGENQKLKDRLKQQPSITMTMENQKVLAENQDLKNQLELLQHKNEVQEKTHLDAIRQLDINWKQDVATLKFQLEQQEINHRQSLRQETMQYKSEIAKLQQNLSKISSVENNNQNLVQVLENELIQVKQINNNLEEKLEQAISQFDLQSKDQEFTLMKQQTIINSQEQYLNELKSKLQLQKDQNLDLLQSVKKLKDVADNKTTQASSLNSRVKELESDFRHVSNTYQEHKVQLQQRVDELIQQTGKQAEQICLLQTQLQRDQELIKRLQVNIENEQKNKDMEVREIQESKAKLIQFLQQELLQQKEQNHQLRSDNQSLDKQLNELKQFYQYNFRELECKTNMLEGECNRLNNIIADKDEEIVAIEMQMKNTFNSQEREDEKIHEVIQIKEQEINLLKQQNESLINDLSRQADNYRHLALQHKQYQKFAEEVKLNNITINELQSKCELQDKEIERLRMKILEKSQQLEKVQKDNLDYQAKLKSRLK